MNRRVMAIAAIAILALAACTNPDRPSVQADEVALPTPLRSYDASIGNTIGQLQSAATAAGTRLVDPVGAYRPSEPTGLLQLPRVVMRADLADPDDGYVVIYEAPSVAAADALATELADYLGSGFGQTNYPADTQFSVAVVGDTIVFTTWSSRRSSDPALAENAFDAVASVGQPVEVQK